VLRRLGYFCGRMSLRTPLLTGILWMACHCGQGLVAQPLSDREGGERRYPAPYGGDRDSLRGRRVLIGAVSGGFTAGSFLYLNRTWYANYDRGGFHFFDDWGEWMQVDKMGHLLSTYSGCRVAGDLWRWAGLERRRAAWVAAGSSMAYLTMVEVLDGFSEKWGFSPGDMLFNAAGTGLYLGQELGWGEQRLTVKLGYRGIRHDPSYRPRTDALFGTGGAERFLKDYNAQTLWLSANLRSFFPESRLPAWLNLAVGHNARMMLGGRENRWTDASGAVVDRSDVQRYRRLLLSLDVDLSRIPVRDRRLRTLLSVVNIVKIPAPALEWDLRGRFRAHALYY